MARSRPVLPPPPPTPLERVLSPFAQFTETESAGGIVLIACTAVALAWANSPWSASYHHLWETELSVGLAGSGFSHSLHWWINDGLMAVFFFLVGLEIKREFLVGELASRQKAALPIAAALGGMIVPALLYTLLNAGGPGERGWGVPMATDIAFAIGVLALLGPRTPTSLKVFLTALAIADDIGAVLVIAVFYTEDISFASLGVGFTLLAVLALANRLGARRPGTYLLVGVAVWMAFLRSGVHATVAGVLLAMVIPTRTRIDTAEFLDRGRRLMDQFDAAGPEGPDILTNASQQAVINEIESACEQAQAPLQRIEHSLHLFVAFGIIPLFALSNAGVTFTGSLAGAFAHPVALGVILGLVLGKPIGITLFAWLAVKTRLAALPDGAGWRGVAAVSVLGGIGFTMSLFVAGLAFRDGALIDLAKIGIFAASVVAGLLGFVALRLQGRAARAVAAAPEPAAV